MQRKEKKIVKLITKERRKTQKPVRIYMTHNNYLNLTGIVDDKKNSHKYSSRSLAKKKGFESIGKKGRVSWAGTFTQKAIPRDALVKV